MSIAKKLIDSVINGKDPNTLLEYSDEDGNDIFGRVNNKGNVDILYVDDGLPVTRLDSSLYPVDSSVSTRYEHPEGITLSMKDAKSLGISIEK